VRYIDADRIAGMVEHAKAAGADEVRRILAKSRSLQRLRLEETAALLSVEEPSLRDELFDAARLVKEAVYGRRIVLFAPLYISNPCVNGCRYCAFRADNRATERKSLAPPQVREQAVALLRCGQKRVLMVAAEGAGGEGSGIGYYVDSVRAIYSASHGPHRIKRVNVNCAPLAVDEFRRLKEAGIGTYQLFQETYHDRTYGEMHPFGPKSDPDNRIDAVERAFQAGIDDIGVGVLYGLYEYRFETLAMLMHIEALERGIGVGPHTISVPRIEPAQGTGFVAPRPVSDDDFRKLVAVLRLSVPYTGIILSTREKPDLRDELFSLGVSQISADSRTSPGGYAHRDNNAHDDTQFKIGDPRSLDDVCGSLIRKGHIPSFCAACYRKERTGEAFMRLARGGTIKDKCTLNALVTLREHLDDFASEKVRAEGHALIEKAASGLGDKERRILGAYVREVEQGARDLYV
jgi:2-iminoacetate synthase